MTSHPTDRITGTAPSPLAGGDSQAMSERLSERAKRLTLIRAQALVTALVVFAAAWTLVYEAGVQPTAKAASHQAQQRVAGPRADRGGRGPCTLQHRTCGSRPAAPRGSRCCCSRAPG